MLQGTGAMDEEDLEYLNRRAAEELRLAQDKRDPTAAAIHQRMALLYADRIAALSEWPDVDPVAQMQQSN